MQIHNFKLVSALKINGITTELRPLQLTGMKAVGKGIMSRPHSTRNSDIAMLLSIRVRDLRTACSPPLERKHAHAGAVHRVKYTNAGIISRPLVSKTLFRVTRTYAINWTPIMSA